MVLDDGLEDRLLELFIAVDRDVSEADHVFHGSGAMFADEGVLT